MIGFLDDKTGKYTFTLKEGTSMAWMQGNLIQHPIALFVCLFFSPKSKRPSHFIQKIKIALKSCCGVNFSSCCACSVQTFQSCGLDVFVRALASCAYGGLKLQVEIWPRTQFPPAMFGWEKAHVTAHCYCKQMNIFSQRTSTLPRFFFE